MKYRVAIGSFSGEYVDQHFGHARKYYIYEFDGKDSSYELIEKRFLETQCECHSSKDAFNNVFETLKDIGAIIISRIGEGASRIVENKGYVLYESFSQIDDVLDKISENRLYEVDKWQRALTN